MKKTLAGDRAWALQPPKRVLKQRVLEPNLRVRTMERPQLSGQRVRCVLSPFQLRPRGAAAIAPLRLGRAPRAHPLGALNKVIPNSAVAV